MARHNGTDPRRGAAAQSGDHDDLLARVARSIRSRRTALRLTHSDLAARAGLSVRFLSDLEAGRGNISIARLAAVAAALDLPVERLVGSTRPTAPDGARARLDAEIAALDDQGVQDALDWIRSRGPSEKHHDKIALVGLRGAGKTSLGKAVAKKLRIAFIELDREIENAAGMPLSDIFGFHGEPYYRRLEREQVKAAIARRGRAIIATGGGIVSDPESFELLRGACFTIWLEASPEDHWSRVVAQGDHRPMKGKPQAMAELRAILDARRDLYARAHARIDTTELGLAGSIAELVRRIERIGK